MRDHQDGDAELVAEFAELVQQLGLDDHVQRGGGFVGDDEIGVKHQAQADHHPLAHTAGELVRIIPQPPFLDAQPADQGTRPLQGRLSRGMRLVDLDGFHQVLVHALNRVERGHRVLEDHADAATAKIAQPTIVKLQNVLALKEDLTGELRLRGGHPQQRFAQRALATAGFADQADDFAFVEIKRDVVHGAQGAQARLVEQRKIADLHENFFVLHCGRHAGLLTAPPGAG
ncbi:MAG: hypothetical protein BWY25_00170 [Chloroflexi bacterium ADurb.Bin222]|nr:MAG: hypothetical protein BWY25_00170 [Chloroflexi bacterium ADurb.Bin222]